MHHTTKIFIDLVQLDINEIRTIEVKNSKFNLIITTTDKGSPVIIQSNYNHNRQRPPSNNYGLKKLHQS